MWKHHLQMINKYDPALLRTSYLSNEIKKGTKILGDNPFEKNLRWRRRCTRGKRKEWRRVRLYIITKHTLCSVFIKEI
jgi:hypothetical protein